MILKGQDILSKPVSAEYGERVIDDIEGLIVDPKKHQVLALFFKEYSLFADQAIPFSSLKQLSNDSIKVYSTSDLVPLRQFSNPRNITISTKLHFKKLLNPQGMPLGYLYDIYFDHESAQILSYEVIIGTNIQNKFRLKPEHLLKATPKSLILTQAASNYVMNTPLSGQQRRLDRFSEIVHTPQTLNQQPSVFQRIQQTLKQVTT